MLHATNDHAALAAGFRWDIPQTYNIGTDVSDRVAALHPDRTALIDVAADGTRRTMDFAGLAQQSTALAAGLVQLGLGRGDRIAVFMPQRIETALAHIAAFKLGAISLPLFTLFGPEALLHRLGDSGAAAVITDSNGAALLAGLRDQLPALRHVICADGPAEGCLPMSQVIAHGDPAFFPAETRAEDPALLIYTSGTTGNPKGALHAHRVMLGHLPGVEVSHDFLPHEGDCFWTPADWGWIGGLMDVLMPALHHGLPVVACRFDKFSAEAAFDLIRREKIRNVFLPPTALKLMRLAPPEAAQGLNLRSVGSGGEPLGQELLDWGHRVLGLEINEFYGQTECNMIVSACSAMEPALPGAIGRPVVGHDVQVIDPETGRICEDGEQGAVACRAPDPVMFLEYWKRPDATAEKFLEADTGRWLLTGDTGCRTPCGRIRFVGRDDDVITSAGYRIGPSEIEDCLLRHPAVHLAGVVGKPDPIRGHVVAAYVTLAEGQAPSDALAQDIALFVKTRLAAHEYPRVVRFITDMPMTPTGKIIRGALRKMAEEESAADD
jgi:acetyl-CoA synthetase